MHSHINVMAFTSPLSTSTLWPQLLHFEAYKKKLYRFLFFFPSEFCRQKTHHATDLTNPAFERNLSLDSDLDFSLKGSPLHLFFFMSNIPTPGLCLILSRIKIGTQKHRGY